MINIEFSQKDIEQLQYWRFNYPVPKIQIRMEALYLKSQGMKVPEIIRLCGISKSSFYLYFHAYLVGGIEKLKELDHYKAQSELVKHHITLEAYFRENPPATVAEAAERIKELTGIERKPTQIRHFLKSLGMKPRKVGVIPAKADVAVQEEFLKKNWSLD